MSSRGGQRPRFSGLRHHPAIPATEPEENAPSRWHGGLLCPPHPRQAGGAQPRSSSSSTIPAASSRRCATGLREPPSPLRPADPPPRLPSGASLSGGDLPGRPEGTPTAAVSPSPSFPGRCWEPSPCPGPAAGLGAARLRPLLRASPGAAKPTDTRQVNQSEPCPRPLLPAGWGGRRLGRRGRVRLENNNNKKRSISADGGREALSKHGRWSPRPPVPVGAAGGAAGPGRSGARGGCLAFGRRAGLGWAGPASPPPPPPASPRAPAPHGSGRCRREQGTVPSAPGDPRMWARRPCWKFGVPDSMTSLSTPKSRIHTNPYTTTTACYPFTQGHGMLEPRNTSCSVNSHLAFP